MTLTPGTRLDALFLAMEYIAGTTLHQRLLEGRMPMPEALHVAGEIAEALRRVAGE